MPHDQPSEDAPIKQISDYPTLFEQLRLRPPMWMGTTSLTAFENVLNGISLAEHFYNIPESERLGGFDFEAFGAWVDQRFNPKQLSANSFWLARDRTSSEEEAFHKWFEWHDEFVSEP